jgi:hypothetical protein
MIAVGKQLARAIGRRRWRSAQCLFILSTGRVGTTTIVNLLNLSRRIQAFHEPEPRLLMEGKVAYDDLDIRWPVYKKVFTEARCEPLGRCAVRRKYYAEAALYPALGPLIADLLPRSRFIHLYRHPGDVVRSGMRRGWYQNHPWDQYRVEPVRDTPVRAAWDTEWDAFAKVCWYWHRINECLLEFTGGLSADRVLRLRFEDFTNPEATGWRKVFDFIDVEAPDEAQVRAVLGERANEQSSGEFPRFSEWSSEQHDTLERIAGVTMRRLGYDRNA